MAIVENVTVMMYRDSIIPIPRYPQYTPVFAGIVVRALTPVARHSKHENLVVRLRHNKPVYVT